MALKAVVFPQDPFNYGAKDLYNLLGTNWNYEKPDSSISDHFLHDQTQNSLYAQWNSSPTSSMLPSPEDPPQTPARTRPKRRRSNARKNKEDIENQRMTHIAVERNRRKQMNEYLSILRSLMPDSYVQRGDQASIIGGAINFVKELEQRLQSLGGQEEVKEKGCSPLLEFFTFPQYSTTEGTQSGIADIEVSMVDSHANIKIRTKKRAKQLLKVVAGMHSMHLTILHLNVTTIDEIVLYSVSLKVEEDSNLNSVDEIAKAVYEMLSRIQEEATQT